MASRADVTGLLLLGLIFVLPGHSLSWGGEDFSVTSATAVVNAPATAPATNPSKEEVLYLLTPRPGMTAQEVVANALLVHDLGQSAYPALAEALAEATDPLLIGTILRAMTDSRGDKETPALAARRLLERYRNAALPNAAVIRIQAARALCTMGRPDDHEVVLDLLDDDNESMRLMVLGFLPGMCSEQDSGRLKECLAKRLAKLDLKQIDTDRTLKALLPLLEALPAKPSSFRSTTATLVVVPATMPRESI